MSKVPTEEDVLGTRMISEDNVTKEMRQEVNLVFVYFSLVAPDTEKRNESRTSDELESKLLRLLTGKIVAGIEKVIRLKKKLKNLLGQAAEIIRPRSIVFASVHQ